MPDPDDARADAIRAGLIAHVEQDLARSPSRETGRMPPTAPARTSRPHRGFRGWAVAAAVVIVAAVAGTVVFSALPATPGPVAAPLPSSDPEPSPSETPAPVYPDLPAPAGAPAAEGLWTCRLAASVFPLGQLGVDSNMDLSRLAYGDLAASLLTEFSDEIATVAPRSDVAGLQIIPKADDLDLDGVFEAAAASLIPQLRELVSVEGLTLSVPIGYSFDDLCGAYLAARALADAARPGSGFHLPLYSVALSNVDAAVVMEVPHVVPEPIRAMQARYGAMVRVDVMPDDYESPTLPIAVIAPIVLPGKCRSVLLDQVRLALVGPVTDRGYASDCNSAGQVEVEVQPGFGEQAKKLLAYFGSNVVVVESPSEFGRQGAQ